MLPVKKAVSNAVSILGRSVSPAEQLAQIKASGCDRDVKDLLRQCLIVAMNYQSNSKESLEKSKTLIRKTGNLDEVTSRSAAFAAASAMKLQKWNDVTEMLQMTSFCPPAIQTSLRVKALAEQKKLDEALVEMEKILMFEEEVFQSANYQISDEALDALSTSIKSSPSDSSEKMKRFRSVQRLITKYHRRTDKSIDQLLFSPILIESPQNEKGAKPRKFPENSKKFDDFVKHVPHFKV